jgi:hypothetical protein
LLYAVTPWNGTHRSILIKRSLSLYICLLNSAVWYEWINRISSFTAIKNTILNYRLIWLHVSFKISRYKFSSRHCNFKYTECNAAVNLKNLEQEYVYAFAHAVHLGFRS